MSASKGLLRIVSVLGSNIESYHIMIFAFLTAKIISNIFLFVNWGEIDVIYLNVNEEKTVHANSYVDSLVSFSVEYKCIFKLRVDTQMNS